jgi:nitrite reductase/ring-hydroxylating ferredoxin subunit
LENKEQQKAAGLLWYKVEGITESELQPNVLKELEAGPKRIGLVKRDNQVFAFAAKCPHAGIPLCTGWIDALGRIVCPEHKYRFDPKNGRNTTGEGYKLFTYPVEIRGDEIWVAFLPPAY